MGFFDRLAHAFNAFVGIDPPSERAPQINYKNLGQSFFYRPDRVYLKRTSEKSTVSTIFNRIAVDCSEVSVKHVKLDDKGRYLEDMDSELNECLTLNANIDQTGKALIRDAVLTMFEEGCCAIVPIDTDEDPKDPNLISYQNLRVGKITQWYPQDVKIEAYNEKTGNKVEIIMPKKKVAIIENPFYVTMNEPNSTLQRLIHKLALLDVVDEQTSSGKLDLIIQLPYVVKNDARAQQAKARRQEIEDQLNGSKYGIAYTDGTEKITQLNRPLGNNLMEQVKYLTSMLYGQFGITEGVINGTAKEEEMQNYYQRSIVPIMDAITDELKRKFLTKTARDNQNRQSIVYFHNPFKYVPITNIADVADKFTRNEILSSNEIRQIVGFKPVQNPEADELRNKNLNKQEGQQFANTKEVSTTDTKEGQITGQTSMNKGGNQNG